MSIIRRTPRENKLVVLDQAFLSDHNLSWAAKGYWAYLQSIEGQEVDVGEPSLEESILIHELMDQDYIVREAS